MTEEILKQLYRQVNDAMVAKDTKKLAELLEPDTVLIHMTGYVQPITEWLEQIDTGDMIYYSWQEDAIKNIKINGNQPVLSDKVVLKHEFGEQVHRLGVCKLKWNLKMLMVSGKSSNRQQALIRKKEFL